MSALANRTVSVISLGKMGFMAAYDVQMRYAKEHLNELAGKPNAHGENTLLLVEHTPVYTVGIRTKNYTKHDEMRLKNSGAEFYKTNRGGLITFHGPGQLVAYPILNLQHFKPSMRWYVCQLEQTMIETLHKFGLMGHSTDQTGVWVDSRKIGSIGLHGSRYVTTHGISLNCNTNLEWYKHIVPCGLEGVEMTSLSKELGYTVDFNDSLKPFLRSFQEVFNCELRFEMMDENELKTMDFPLRSSVTGSGGLTSRSDCSVRHMSTLSSLSDKKQQVILQSKFIPKW